MIEIKQFGLSRIVYGLQDTYLMFCSYLKYSELLNSRDQLNYL